MPLGEELEDAPSSKLAIPKRRVRGMGSDEDTAGDVDVE